MPTADIGGCRAILGGGQPEIEAVLRDIRNRWEVRGFKDYVNKPAPSGYRACHVVVVQDDRLIEIQLRTPTQHLWAEAVERTALRLRMDLKDGQGPAELLEYFRMAAEGMALVERGESLDDSFKAHFGALRERIDPYLHRTS